MSQQPVPLVEQAIARLSPVQRAEIDLEFARMVDRPPKPREFRYRWLRVIGTVVPLHPGVDAARCPVPLRPLAPWKAPLPAPPPPPTVRRS